MMSFTVWRQGAFPASRQHGSLSCFIHNELILPMFTQYTSGESGAFSHANTTQKQAWKQHWIHQMTGNRRRGRFQPKLLRSENADLKFSTNNGETDDNKKPAEQREHRRQRRQRETKKTPATATTNMYKASTRHYVQLHGTRNRWREGKPTADASRKCRQ